MRYVSPSVRNLSITSRLLYGVGLLCLILLTLLTLVLGSMATTLAAVLVLALYMVSAPFVLGGRWRAPKSRQPSRRPVVRRRRY